ncbi:MAG: hypothetical protein HWE27_13245 [Gammaproteobacteria bacterium]|nr:hypothetical protein [Gammaproteobacteria bacterium]
MDSPSLTYPAQQQGQHLLVETNPSDLKKWLKSLPYGDMGRAVPDISQAIASLNRSELNLATRRELVALFDNAYAQIFDAYRPYPNHITNEEALRKEHSEIHVLTREMAFAHKILTDSELKKKRLWGKNKDLIRAINLSMHYLGLLLMEHYETYSPIPAYLWRECNGLYAYAQNKQLEDTVIFENGHHQCLPTIEKTFARICLLSLSDPYHLAQGEHWQLFKYLEKWNHRVEFSDDRQDFNDAKCFVIQLDSQIKPIYSSQYEGDIITEKNICLMLTNDLVKQLNYQVELSIQKGEMAEGFYKNLRPVDARVLLEHMLGHWNAKIERKGKRYPVLTKLDIIWGLQPIYDLIQKHRQSPESAHWDSNTIESFIGHEHSLPLNWDAANVSDGGIGVRAQQNIAHKLKVGELVIIREYIDKKPSFRWRLGVCRWLFGDDSQGTNAGLEFIDGTIEPCRINSKMSQNSTSAGQIALLFQPTANQRDSALRILAARGTYLNNRELLLRNGNQLEEIKAKKRTLITPCIEMFKYQSEQKIELANTNDNAANVTQWDALAKLKQAKENPDEQNINLDDFRLPGER